MAKFHYVKRTTEQWAARANQQAGSWEGFIRDEYQTYNPRKGDHWLRVLPPTWKVDGENPPHYGYDAWVHYSVGPDNASILCLQKMRGERCPLCEARIRAERTGDEDIANELKPIRRVLMWVLDRKDRKASPLIWAAPWTVDRDISKVSHDKLTGVYYNIDDPDEGYDIMFDREGESLNTKYVGLQLARRTSDVDQASLDYIAEHPLPDTLRWRSYDEVARLYEGAEPTTTKHATNGGEREPERRRPEPEDRRSRSQREEDEESLEKDRQHLERITRPRAQPRRDEDEPPFDPKPQPKLEPEVRRTRFSNRD